MDELGSGDLLSSVFEVQSAPECLESFRICLSGGTCCGHRCVMELRDGADERQSLLSVKSRMTNCGERECLKEKGREEQEESQCANVI